MHNGGLCIVSNTKGNLQSDKSLDGTVSSIDTLADLQYAVQILCQGSKAKEQSLNSGESNSPQTYHKTVSGRCSLHCQFLKVLNFLFGFKFHFNF